MNKQIIEEYLAESLSHLEMARDHAAYCDSVHTQSRLHSLCQNVSDLLDQLEDDSLLISFKPRYTSAQAQLLYQVLQHQDAASLQPNLDSESCITLNEALANLRMELLAYAAQGDAVDPNASHTDCYSFDDPVDGQ